MGGGSETIRSAQIVGLSDKHGALKKKIMLENGKFISSGMDVVVKARGQSIVEIKSLYNKKYLEAFGYAPNDSILIDKISDGKVLEYTKNNINNKATYISNPIVNTLGTLDQAILELQDKPNFKRSEMSFTHTDSKKYYYFTSVQNGSYIDISCYMNRTDTVTPYLKNKYLDGYTILDMNTYPLVNNGRVYWKAEVKYTYYEDVVVDEKTIVNGKPTVVEKVIKVKKTAIATEHIDCIFIYFTVLDTEEAQMYAIAQQHSGPFTTVGTYIVENDEVGDSTYTATVTGTFTVTYIGNGEFSYNMNAPAPGGLDKYENMAWSNGVVSYQAQKVAQIEQAVKDNVRKLIWDYGVDREDIDGVRRTYVLGNILNSFIVKEQADAYPIIPLKRYFNFVNNSKMDIVLKKIGIEGKDFRESLSNPYIVDAYLFFGVPFGSSNPALIQYIFEFFTTLSNVRENYQKNAQRRGANSLNISFDGMGIHQNYYVRSWVEVEPATRPVGTYWFEEVSETVLAGYEEVPHPDGIGKIQVPIYETHTYPEYYRQESEFYYIRIRPSVVNYWYTLGGLEWGNGDGRFGDSGGSGNDIELRIPILKQITNKMSFNLLCDLLEQSMCIAYYTEQVVKTKWYQTGFFKFLTIGILIIFQQYGAIAIMFATEVITDRFGAQIGGIFQIVATVVLLVTQNYGAAFEMTAKNILLTASQVLNIVSQANNLLFGIDIEKKQKNYESILNRQKAEKDKLQEEYEELYENEGMLVNMFNNVKTLDDIDNYYNMATGNFDSYYLMLDYATDYDKFYVTK